MTFSPAAMSKSTPASNSFGKISRATSPFFKTNPRKSPTAARAFAHVRQFFGEPVQHFAERFALLFARLPRAFRHR